MFLACSSGKRATVAGNPMFVGRCGNKLASQEEDEIVVSRCAVGGADCIP